MRPLGFSVPQGEIGIGAAGPRGPRGLPGPRVGLSMNVPGLGTCSFHQPDLEVMDTAMPSRS